MTKPSNIVNEVAFEEGEYTITLYEYERPPIGATNDIDDDVMEEYRFGDVEELPISDKRCAKYATQDNRIDAAVEVLADDGDVIYNIRIVWSTKWREVWQVPSYSDGTRAVEAFLESWCNADRREVTPIERWETAIAAARSR